MYSSFFIGHHLRVHMIRIDIVLYCTSVLSKVQSPEIKVQKENKIFNSIVDVRRTRIVLFFSLFVVPPLPHSN